VPAPAAGDAAAGKYLKASGGWDTPAGAGNVSTGVTLTTDNPILGAGGSSIKIGAINLAGGSAYVTGDLPFANVAQLAGLSVAGVTGSSTADLAAITAGTDGYILTRVSSSSLAFAQPGFALIEEQTPSGTGTLTFSSLGAFTHLMVVWSARGSQAATTVNMSVQFNGDTAGNYDAQLVSGAGSTPTAAESLGATSGLVATLSAASATSGRVGIGSITIHDYRGTTFNKMATTENTYIIGTSSGNMVRRAFGVNWRSTAAITSMTLLLSAGNYDAGSKFTLYGLR
jgi:hypothetical protein